MGVACVVAMMVLTTADVVARYVFNSPTMWADEMASYLLIAIVFLGLAHNLRTDGHIRIDVAHQPALAPPRAVLEVFAYAVGIVFVDPADRADVDPVRQFLDARHDERLPADDAALDRDGPGGGRSLRASALR